MEGKREGVSMYGQRKEQVGAADWGFVAFVIIITAIAVTLTLSQIYLQNPG
jgi:hypothetical protein